MSKDYCTQLIEAGCSIFNKTYHHSPAIVELSAINYQAQVTETKYVYNFEEANFSGLNLYLKNIDWAIALNLADLQVMHSAFLRLFWKELINSFVKKLLYPSHRGTTIDHQI